jgi:signal transduction histidine kinase
LISDDGDAQAVGLDPEQDRRLRRIASLKDGLTRMDRALRLLPGAEGNGEPAATDFDANELIKEVFGSLRQLVRRNNVELKLRTPDAPVPISGRRPWIRQALFNVAVDRLNAMRAGGSLSVEAATTPHGIVVTVRDDVAEMPGAAIGESDRSFCPGRSNAGVTGLQVARFIIEAHAGTIEITRGGAGTEVVLRLPSQSAFFKSAG